MVRRSASVVLLPLFAIFCVPALVTAQQTRASTSEGAPAHVSFVEGSVTLEREGRLDDAPANMPLLAGDRLRTRAGRAEVLFADGSLLHLDNDTTLDLQSDELLRLIGGRLRLSIPGPSSRELGYRIDTANGWAEILESGEYRASLMRDELEVAVLRGRAELVNDAGRTSLRAGERAFARGNAAPSYAYVFNSAAWDAFDRWSEERRNERLGLSTQYLPQEVRSYSATFDRYGSWNYDASYGYVWYPRVEVGWRPYYYGRWVPYQPYGVAWVSTHPWGWATHHYGRWGFNAGVWFWIPGRTWGPAWVSWGYAPGYVSWCPLGWNNRPVVYAHYGHYKGYDPWRAWTVVPHQSFGHGYVNRTVVAGYRVDERTRLAFNYGERPPAIVGRAVPRTSVAAAPIRVAGTGAARSAGAPLLTNRGTATVNPATSTAARSFGSRPMNSESTSVRAAESRTVPANPAVNESRGSVAVLRGTPDRAIYQPPASRNLEISRGRTTASSSGDLPVYQRPDGYRATPDTYAPGPQRATPRTIERAPSYGAPPSYGSRPSYGAPPAGESRTAQPRGTYGPPPSYAPPRGPSGGESSGRPPGGTQAQPPSAGPDRGSARPEGSRPSGGVPSRGAARPRGGR